MRLKFVFFAIIISLLYCSCKNDDDAIINNPYLHYVTFDSGSQINTSLPQYSNLQFPGNHVVLYNYGINGIIVINNGLGIYAFEITDPSHTIESCSVMNVSGLEATCTCSDLNRYSLATGTILEGTGSLNMITYRTEISGSIIRVYN